MQLFNLIQMTHNNTQVKMISPDRLRDGFLMDREVIKAFLMDQVIKATSFEDT